MGSPDAYHAPISPAIGRLSTAIEALEGTDDPSVRRSTWAAYARHVDGDLDDLARHLPTVRGLALRLREIGTPGEGWSARASSLLAAVRAQVTAAGRLRVVAPGESVEADDLADVVPAEVDLPAGYSLPTGYVLAGSGVWRTSGEEGEGAERIAVRPILVVGRLRDAETGAYHLEVAFDAGGRWARRVIPRDVAADARRIVPLAIDGLPVDSTTSGRLVAYLSAAEAHLVDVVPEVVAASSLGWVPGTRRFLWGATGIGEGPEVSLVTASGTEAHVAGFRRAGELARWVALLEACRPYPRIVLAVYAAASTCLLGIVPDAPGYVVDWSGETSAGKTTALLLGASVWGRPADLVQTWDTTRTGVERLAALYRHLPTILDDTKQARDPEAVSGVVYQITGTRGRLRASVDGLRATPALRTVLLSTGEAPVTSATQDAGARARVLSIRGSTFGVVSADARRVAERVAIEVLEHHGHLGPELVAWLARRPPAGLVERWRAYRGDVELDASGAAGRASAYLATLRLVAHVIEAAIGWRVDEAALAEARRWAGVSILDADRPLAALVDVLDWIDANPGQVARGSSAELRELLAYAPGGESGAPTRLGIAWARVADRLSRAGYDPAQLRRQWTDRGWITSARWQPRIGGLQVSLVEVSAAGLEAAEAARG